MVMPSMPIFLSASFTSSILCGWMMASIFFILVSILGFEVVAFLAVHAQVETFDLVLIAGAQAEHRVAHYEDNPGADDGEPPGDGGAEQVVEHLAGIAVDQAH